METRNILDYQGNIIGQLELPSSTTEQEWALHLALYAVNPNAGSASSFLKFTIKQRKEYCETLLEEFKARNVGLGINAPQGMWMHHRMRAMEITFMGVPMTLDILNLAISGDIEVACLTLMYSTPDDGTQFYHWYTQEVKDLLIADMKSFLGWA